MRRVRQANARSLRGSGEGSLDQRGCIGDGGAVKDWPAFDRALTPSELNYRHRAQVPSDFEIEPRAYAKWTTVVGGKR